MASYPEKVEIDFLILADKAEVLNGKLYMMGGGYDRQFIANIENPVSMSAVIGILVPWNLTNEQHTFTLQLEDLDGNAIKPTVQGEITVGRPPDASKGQVFRAMAIIQGRWKLPQLGTYRVVATISEEAQKSVTFYALPRQPQAAVQPGPSEA